MLLEVNFATPTVNEAGWLMMDVLSSLDTCECERGIRGCYDRVRGVEKTIDRTGCLHPMLE